MNILQHIFRSTKNSIILASLRYKLEHVSHHLKLHKKAKERFQIQINSISKYVSIRPLVNNQNNDMLKTLKGYGSLITHNSHAHIFYVHSKFPIQRIMKNIRTEIQSSPCLKVVIFLFLFFFTCHYKI